MFGMIERLLDFVKLRILRSLIVRVGHSFFQIVEMNLINAAQIRCIFKEYHGISAFSTS